MESRKLKRAKFIHFRVGQAERLALERLCSLEQAGISETMRVVLRQVAQQRGVWPTREQQTEGGQP